MTQNEDYKLTLSELDDLYLQSETCDSEIFAEMRSNVLLISGQHYTKKRSIFYKRIRDSKELTDTQKLRLTKNHIQKITKIYADNITSMAPGVTMVPNNETELQDQKAAELHSSVWSWAKEKYRLEELKDEWCDDFVGLGEVATKIFFDPDHGQVVNVQPVLDEMGMPMFDEQGMPLMEEIKEGKFIFERIMGFNLLRAKEAKDLKESAYFVLRKMVNTKDLIAKFKDKEGKIKDSMDETMMVFDEMSGGYSRAEGQVLLREFYFRPCSKYPKGYYIFATKDVILTAGELPVDSDGECIFPIIVQPFDKHQTAPRGQSPVKVMRPYQMEINRAASKIAEHQITLGDDKILIQNGTKVSSGVALPGVRSINFTGMSPSILPGRDGSQYLAYSLSQISELYEVMNVQDEEKKGDVDPYALLYRSASQKKKFKRYVRRFEIFLKDVANTFLRLAKLYLDENTFILAAGRNELVNISEFKNTDPIGYSIKVEPQSEDIETKLGKQLTLNHMLQYVGNKLEREDIGKIMRQMPYGNVEDSFSDFTLDYDLATNDILALDRGELPPISENENHQYMEKRLVARMRQADFKFLAPEIQNNYEMKRQAHLMALAEQERKIMVAKQGLIPSGGYLVALDFYVPKEDDPTKTQRARLPYEAIEWLIQALETQGQSLEKLETMNQGSLAQLSEMMMSQQNADMGQGQDPRMQIASNEMPA